MDDGVKIVQIALLCLCFNKGLTGARPNLKVQLSVEDSDPLFQGNKTKLHLNLTHDNRTSSVATQVALLIEASYQVELDTLVVAPGSLSPVEIRPNEFKFSKFEHQDQFSGTANISIDPYGLAKPGNVHVAHVIATLTYGRHQDNCTDPYTGEILEKATEYAYISFYFYVSDSPCVEALGMKNGLIMESQVSSSSFHKDSKTSLGKSPHQARLGGEGYWTPVGGNASIDRKQFLQIKFQSPINLKMIAMQGKPNSTEHVRTFDIYTSINGEDWRKEKPILRKGFSAVATTGDTSVLTAFQSPAPTLFLQINPRTWYKEVALRVEIFGCIQPAGPTQEFPSLGVETKVITDAQMTASSSLLNTSAASGRLNFNNAWCSATSNESQLYLQIDLNETHHVTAVATQSRDTNDGHFASVTSYKLSHSEDGVTWTVYQQNGLDKIFLGNLVEHMPTKHHLALPVKTRFIRFQPVTSISSVCLRVELYGDKSAHENTDKPPMYQRSFLLDTDHQRLFVCDKGEASSKSSCYFTRYTEGEKWTAMDRRLVSILGYDKAQGKIYGVAANRKSYIKCNSLKCVSVAKESWLNIRTSPYTVLATEITSIPETGQDITDAPISVYKVKDSTGRAWSASAVGFHFQAAEGQPWELKARWRSKDLNKCYSSPCENGGSCDGDHKNYICTCPKGLAGQNCEIKFFPWVKTFSCNGTATLKSTWVISSPNYPSNYGNNKICTWEIASFYRVKLVFTYFYTERYYDFLYVYNGVSSSAPLIDSYSGEHTGKVVQITGHNIFVKFHTDGSVTYKGFEISVTDAL